LHKKLYDIVGEILKTYGEKMEIRNLYDCIKSRKPGTVILPIVNKVRINAMCSALSVSVRGCHCEIVLTEENREHESVNGKKDQIDLHFKIQLSDGRYYMKCFKERCRTKMMNGIQIQKTGQIYFAEDVYLKALKEITCNDPEFVKKITKT
jgi:hypothetical protein